MQRPYSSLNDGAAELAAGARAPEVRREFLVKAASMLGLAASAGALGALATACESTVVKTDPSTSPGGTNPGGTNPGGTNPGGADNVISITQETNLQRVGGAVIRTVRNRTLVIIRSGAQEFLAFSALCTHEGCVVNLPINGVLDCLCHGSRFDASTGRVLTGPAGMPLQQFEAKFDPMQNTVTISV